uniref:Uncharacterized protein n=1 Tax=Rhizophora mucronata TaxID=61149 RepID=A0A2P2QWF5_RHIMU
MRERSSNGKITFKRFRSGVKTKEEGNGYMLLFSLNKPIIAAFLSPHS